MTNSSFSSFVKQYVNLGEQMVEAAREWADEVRCSRFPVMEGRAGDPVGNGSGK
jgi:ketopantoate hydroxymethyltransferase